MTNIYKELEILEKEIEALNSDLEETNADQEVFVGHTQKKTNRSWCLKERIDNNLCKSKKLQADLKTLLLKLGDLH